MNNRENSRKDASLWVAMFWFFFGLIVNGEVSAYIYRCGGLACESKGLGRKSMRVVSCG
jgi:hypothetical protein